MASLLYPKFKEALLKADIDMENDTIRAVLIDLSDHSYDPADEFLEDVPSAARVGSPQTLGSKTFTNGVFDAANITFPEVTGDQCEAILIYQWTGAESTAHLVALIDSGEGLPITPNGSNIPVTWPDGPSKIFKL